MDNDDQWEDHTADDGDQPQRTDGYEMYFEGWAERLVELAAGGKAAEKENEK